MPEEFFKTGLSGTCLVVTFLIEEMKLYNSMDISNSIEEILKKSSFKEIVLDLERVKFIDSSGIGSLVNIKKLAGRYGAEMIVACSNNDIIEIINTTGIGRFFKIFPSAADAEKYIREKV